MKLWLAVLALSVANVASAQSLVVPGKKATLSVDYTFESTGSFAGSLASAEWRVRRTLSTSVTLQAAQPGPLSQMNPPDAAQVAAMEARAAAAQQAAAQIAPNMSNMMAFAAGAEALAEKCGDDEECFMREAQKFLSGSNAAELGRAAGAIQQNIEPALAPDAPRYQVWRQSAQSQGTYAIDETLSLRTRDPLCISQPNDTCTVRETRKGGGTVPGGNGGGPAAFEVDSQGKTLTMFLPVVLTRLGYQRSFASTHPEDANLNGDRPAELSFPGSLELPASHVSQPTKVDVEVTPIQLSLSGDALPATGTQTFEAVGSEGERVKLTAVWRLAVQ